MSLEQILNDYLEKTECCVCHKVSTFSKKCFTCKPNYPYNRSIRHLVYYNRITEESLKEALTYVDVICFSCLYKKDNTFTPKGDSKQYPLAKKTYRKELISWFRDIRSNGVCADCGKHASDGTYKEFQYHHIEPSTKICEVSFMVQQCNSKEKIQDEMNKCVLLCRSCHIKRHR